MVPVPPEAPTSVSHEQNCIKKRLLKRHNKITFMFIIPQNDE